MNALRNFQILHQNPDLRPLCGHIDTKNCTMLCAVLTPLKKQKNLACHYIVTVEDLTVVKGSHYIVTSMGGTDSGVNDVLCHKSSPHKLITTFMQKLEEAICQRSTQELEQIW